MSLHRLGSEPTDLWNFFVRNGQFPQQGFPIGEGEDGVDISQLPPELQKFVREHQANFKEGDVDRIDTDNELRHLLGEVIGTDGSALPNNPGVDALQNLSQAEMAALLVDYVLSRQNEQNKPTTPGQHVGRMGGRGFQNGAQPTSWNGGGNSGNGSLSTGGGGGGGTSASGPITQSNAGAQGVPDVSSFKNLSAEQKQNAQVIIDVGRQMGASDRDIQIALMTAMQESGLKNLDYGDRDSLGLFQQRPSQGWGSPEQVTNPQYAARKFYEGLLGISNRDSMALTEAAQAVQRSAFPDAYAKHEGVALALLQELA